MNKIPCLYSVIRFLPYRETEEFANVGILLFSEKVGYLAHRLETSKHARFTDFFLGLRGWNLLPARVLLPIRHPLEGTKKIEASHALCEDLVKKAGVEVVDADDVDIVPQINERIAKEKFNHYLPANHLAKTGAKATDFKAATLDRFEKMFKAVNSLF